MIASNGHSMNCKGGLGGIAQIPEQRKVRADLSLIERMIDLGCVEASRFQEVLDLCQTIRKDANREIRDQIRASELETKVLGLSLAAAMHSDKNSRLDNGQLTDRIGLKAMPQSMIDDV